MHIIKQYFIHIGKYQNRTYKTNTYHYAYGNVTAQ